MVDLKRSCSKFDLGQGQGHNLIGKGHTTYESIRIVVLKTSEGRRPLVRRAFARHRLASNTQ